MIEAAIIGLGWWGKNIVNAVQGKSDRLRFVRGVALDCEPLRGFAAAHGFDLSSDLGDALAEPRVRLVVIATPHSLHPAQVIATAEAGKAVFCEKPLALHRADAERMVESCRRAGVPLGLGANKRFWPSMQELAAAVKSGQLGEVLHIEGHYSNENSRSLFAGWRSLPSEAPGGPMTGAALHVLDAFVHLMGPVGRIQTQLVSRRPAPDPLDAVSVLLEFANGASGVLASMRATSFYWRVRVFGTAGSAEALGENELVLRGAGGPLRRFTYPPVDSLRAELDAFADAVEGKTAPPIPPEQMIDTVGAFEAIVKSLEASHGQPM
jgi:predicted dehydrogenase